MSLNELLFPFSHPDADAVKDDMAPAINAAQGRDSGPGNAIQQSDEASTSVTNDEVAQALQSLRIPNFKGPNAQMRKVLEAFERGRAQRQAPPMTVPEGYKLVPLTPSREMIAATADDSRHWTDAEIYRAMVAVAPQPIALSPWLQTLLRQGLADGTLKITGASA